MSSILFPLFPLRGMPVMEKKLPALKNPYVQVSMRMRYIKGMKIKDICETLSYSDRQVIRFLKQGEQEINRAEE